MAVSRQAFLASFGLGFDGLDSFEVPTHLRSHSFLSKYPTVSHTH